MPPLTFFGLPPFFPFSRAATVFDGLRASPKHFGHCTIIRTPLCFGHRGTLTTSTSNDKYTNGETSRLDVPTTFFVSYNRTAKSLFHGRCIGEAVLNRSSQLPPASQKPVQRTTPPRTTPYHTEILDVLLQIPVHYCGSLVSRFRA